MLQRKCACGRSSGVPGEYEDCDKKRLSLHRSTRNSELQTRNSEGVPPIVHEVLRSRGQPLDPQTRAFMEPRFGHDFSNVRVHTDARAAESASAVSALAYTVGRDVVFGAGQYAPETSAGRRLLAHELTHVVQQHGSSEGSVRIGQSGDPYEEEASRAAETLSSQGPVPMTRESGPRLSRTDEPERVWGGFRISGESDFVNSVRADLNRLNGTSAGAAVLQEISEYAKPFYRSYIRISPLGACGFLPDSGIYYVAGGCNVPNNCSGARSDWNSVANFVYLYHEIVHAYLYHIAGKGTHPQRECMVTGLGDYFRTIPHNENRLRCELGLPVRPCYDGQCTLPAPTCGQTTAPNSTGQGD